MVSFAGVETCAYMLLFDRGTVLAKYDLLRGLREGREASDGEVLMVEVRVVA